MRIDTQILYGLLDCSNRTITTSTVTKSLPYPYLRSYNFDFNPLTHTTFQNEITHFCQHMQTSR